MPGNWQRWLSYAAILRGFLSSINYVEPSNNLVGNTDGWCYEDGGDHIDDNKGHDNDDMCGEYHNQNDYYFDDNDDDDDDKDDDDDDDDYDDDDDDDDDDDYSDDKEERMEWWFWRWPEVGGVRENVERKVEWDHINILCRSKRQFHKWRRVVHFLVKTDKSTVRIMQFLESSF